MESRKNLFLQKLTSHTRKKALKTGNCKSKKAGSEAVKKITEQYKNHLFTFAIRSSIHVKDKSKIQFEIGGKINNIVKNASNRQATEQGKISQ